MSEAGPVTRACGSCRKTRLSGCNPGDFCTIASGPEPWGQAADPASIASSVAEAVTRAMSCLRPAGTGRVTDG